MRKVICSAFLLIALGSFVILQKTQAGDLEEYRVKAAFLYNFAKFIQWPQEIFANPNSPVSLGIIGKDPFGEALEPFRNKALGERKLFIKHIERIEEANDVNMLFICSSEHERMAQFIRILAGKPILTISDINSFAKQGGMIGLVPSDNKVHFEINLRAARQSGLEISSKLLKLAESVIDER